MHVGFQRRTPLDSCKGIVPGESPGIRVCSERAQLAEHRLLLRGEGVVGARGTPPDLLCIDSETPLLRRAPIVFQLTGQRVGKGVDRHRERDPAACHQPSTPNPLVVVMAFPCRAATSLARRQPPNLQI
jgi:hypothetical protein